MTFFILHVSLSWSDSGTTPSRLCPNSELALPFIKTNIAESGIAECNNA